jgi:glycerol-3-phosphate dehydrogenase (NAD(P)+)
MKAMARIGVVGGGAFGTAMACVSRRSGHDVIVWAREPEVAAAINEQGANPVFLPGVRLPPGIAATADLAAALAGCDFALLAVPAQHMRSIASRMQGLLDPGTPLVSCSKGIERGTLALMPRVLQEALPAARVAVLSGPSFARDIAAGLPAGVTLACSDYALAKRLCGEIGNPGFCVHPSRDVTGAAVGGVMKNVIAIASGILAGRRLGESARATLVTLGLEETVRLGLALGAQRETFDGFAGVGDLMLTAGSVQSRNTSLGVALGEGRRLDEILAARREVTEGAHSAESIAALARRHDLRLPIAEGVDAILNHGADLAATLEPLLAAACALNRPGGQPA